jgi:hypothetical protein
MVSFPLHQRELNTSLFELIPRPLDDRSTLIVRLLTLQNLSDLSDGGYIVTSSEDMGQGDHSILELTFYCIIQLLVRPLVVLDDGPELSVVFLSHGLPELKVMDLNDGEREWLERTIFCSLEREGKRRLAKLS